MNKMWCLENVEQDFFSLFPLRWLGRMKRVRAEQAGAADGVPKTSVGWKAAPRWSYTSSVPKEKKIKECVIFVLDV